MTIEPSSASRFVRFRRALIDVRLVDEPLGSERRRSRVLDLAQRFRALLEHVASQLISYEAPDF